LKKTEDTSVQDLGVEPSSSKDSFQQTKCRKDATAAQTGLGDFTNKVTEASEYGYDRNGNR